MSGSWAPFPVLVAAHLVGAAALAWIVYSYLDFGAVEWRLLLAYLLPYAVAYAVMAVNSQRAGRQGRTWAREEWRLHLTTLCLAPVLSVGVTPVFERTLGLDHHTALSAGLAIGCGVLATAATSVVSLRVMYARELRKRASAAPTAAPSSRISSPVA
ncbi:hypothetical protein [Streptomyces sp. NPDC056468]|uniref:hypothetical protein n=1 Tax=Streptomyces sp. NPDC056468 TaxID=3345830 RepID=UPI0036A01679